MNIYYIGDMPITDELYHYGILGQKWGVRRYQNPDGTLTSEGKKRYSGTFGTVNIKRDLNRLEKEYAYSKGDEHKANTKRDAKAVQEAQKHQEEIESQIWQLLAAAHELNYDVLTTPSARSTVRKGEQWIKSIPTAITYPASMLYGPAAGFMVGAVTGALAGAGQTIYDANRYGGYQNLTTETNKYKVKKNGTGKLSIGR